jgi:hypothetical protein
MREIDHIMTQIRSRYDNNWRDWIMNGTDIQLSFPLAAPSAQVIGREFDAVARWTQAWQRWSKAHPAAHLRTATRRTILGSQEVVTHLDLSSIDDLVSVDRDLAAHWRRANDRWSRLRALPGSVPVPRLRPKLQQIFDLAGADFDVLIAAVSWFTENPRSGLTIRQVPVVGMHTKWLARNRQLVLACLSIHEQPCTEIDNSDEELAQDALDPLGLVALPVHLHVILADPADRALVGGLRHLCAPLPEVDTLPVHPETVVIIENKESAYLIPDRQRTVIVHSLGNHLNVLDRIGWLAGAEQLYWGDLDRAGFTLLSRARARLPHLASVLMDPVTLAEHKALAVDDETRADPPESNLTDTETAALAALATEHRTYLRLEQERLPAPFVVDQIGRAMEDGCDRTR